MVDTVASTPSAGSGVTAGPATPGSGPAAPVGPGSAAVSSAIDWTAVGSVGTAVGAFAALGTIVLTGVLARRQRIDEQASARREDLRGFVVAAHALIRTLQDGGPVIAASWAARAVLREALPAGAGAPDLRALLRAGDVGITAAVVAWERSAEAQALRARVQAVQDAGRRLGGRLQLLSVGGELLVALADDVRMAFLQLLHDPAAVAAFLQKTQALNDLDGLLNALSRHLHATVSAYVQARYSTALRAMDDFVAQAAAALAALSAGDLLAAALARATSSAASRTGAMRVHLSALEPALGADVPARLRRLIDAIEVGVSKETAAGHLGEG